ncbi:iron chelate uptake ABC transporter family permease subunit [Ruania albidiflava]|uniref:iron chelate uptake ABC transporter family permease subunit n=1 Tax=Ruania albidiflava TaxID=366586 RepID=UPI0003B5BCFF|nr:iron chelate uptake ABC transporter family permease subunit [Ruania albidiflava]
MAELTTAVRATPTPPRTVRTSAALPGTRRARRYWLVLIGLALLAAAFGIALVVWDNPMPVGTAGFWRIVALRSKNVLVMLIVAFCQAMATVAFQTVTTNRIVTPSILGFESLYVAVQTGAIYLLGATGLTMLTGVPQFIGQIVLMVGLAVALYGWLLSGKHGNLHVLLLIGIIIGAGLGSVSTFLQRLLTPSEFDLLTARLFGSISSADADYLPIAVPLAAGAGLLLWRRARRLNVMALGRDVTTGLGLNHRRELVVVLVLVAVLMATSTALVGPMTFLGFLVATLAYQFADTHDHRHVLPVAVLTGFVVLSGAYFVMKNLFYAQGVVSIIIELVGGVTFLVVILRKGRL